MEDELTQRCRHHNPMGQCWICAEAMKLREAESEFEKQQVVKYCKPEHPTRREIAVQFALKLIDRATAMSIPIDAEDTAELSTKYTDALLAELEKGKANQ